MTDQIGSILGDKWETPPEIKAIKDYVRNKFKSNVGVTIQPNQIVISAASAALAGTLRLHIRELQNVTKTDMRLVIRIGH